MGVVFHVHTQFLLPFLLPMWNNVDFYGSDSTSLRALYLCAIEELIFLTVMNSSAFCILNLQFYITKVFVQVFLEQSRLFFNLINKTLINSRLIKQFFQEYRYVTFKFSINMRTMRFLISHVILTGGIFKAFTLYNKFFLSKEKLTLCRVAYRKYKAYMKQSLRYKYSIFRVCWYVAIFIFYLGTTAKFINNAQIQFCIHHLPKNARYGCTIVQVDLSAFLLEQKLVYVTLDLTDLKPGEKRGFLSRICTSEMSLNC